MGVILLCSYFIYDKSMSLISMNIPLHWYPFFAHCIQEQCLPEKADFCAAVALESYRTARSLGRGSRPDIKYDTLLQSL